jgi:Zn-dependent M28 family amino/carboxypeptidase
MLALLGLLGSAVLPPAAIAAPGASTKCEDRDNNTYQKLLECITLEGVMEHMAAFQAIGDANDDEYYPGTRAAGTEGYARSAEYVAGLLTDAGYQVTLDEFEFEFVFPSLLQQLTPVNASYATGSYTASGFGDITGNVIPVDLNLTGTRASTSGCDGAFREEGATGSAHLADPGGTDDFAGLNFSGSNDIALIQRGTCGFALKAHNAEFAGAEAVIVMNQGNAPDRQALIVGNAGAPNYTPAIPVVGASFADGSALAANGSTARVRVLEPETRTDVNVIADLPGVNTNNVVMAGAHLDSEVLGPGINDNGSGSAALLETALMLANHEPQNSLRFGWWGAEESGLVGSEEYVEGLSQAERDRIALYMNYDMVASPNYIFMVYDADESTFDAPVVVPPGSEAIEDVYERYYTWVGEPYEDSEFSGRSDYQAFIEAGIPSAGLFTGAEVPKTAEQAAIWGGTAGAPFDPCYHVACDTIGNLNDAAFEVNSDLIAFAQLTFAYSTESVNGVKGAKLPGKALILPEPAGPEGTFGSTGGDDPGPVIE